MSKIVVTDSAGAVRSQTAQELVKCEAELRVMTRAANRIASLPKGVESTSRSMLGIGVFAGGARWDCYSNFLRNRLHRIRRGHAGFPSAFCSSDS
jgi:hypothetical protein